MTHTKTLKILGTAIIAVAFTSGAAIAGPGKDCNHKDHSTAMKSEASQQTAVLPASTERTNSADQKQMKAYTFDEALALCQKHGATDLQACVDKKTGKVNKPKA